MTPAQFCKIGEALRGPHWKRALANDLGVHERSVKHYASGARPLPHDMPQRLRTLLARHASRLESLALTLERTRTRDTSRD